MEIVMTPVREVPCHHIYAYYQYRWEQHHCIAWNLLRRGYYQWSHGLIECYNNLFDRD
ncbi:hypothetical protein EVB68_003 [Rhizobium phage RHph_Y2_6]|uniref:Uncharacterized protein n=1 Tax=Rhizobium phage RHph_Y2_6 TaxID=2509576 RepID=A0A7S5R692_9CAUD|nr:hypothetical protein PP748_gp003 [Rhizobium phage RHph_Y2_6]QIG68740.1 hypothetical protein EVB68_003 [Rhizobium phage RHph_Y2_6]